MRVSLIAALLATACSQAQPKPVPEATRESAGQSTDAGSRAANEPGGSSLGAEDAGARQRTDNDADAGQQAAADSGQSVGSGIKQGASEAMVSGTNRRNAPSMENVAYYQSLYWDGRAPTMEAVSAAAWKGQLGADPDAIAAKLNGILGYRAQFQRAFKEDATGKNIPMAMAAFLRALKTGNSKWDKFEQGEGDAVSMEARRGYRVFQNARCTLCHVPPLYTDSQFHNVGVGYDKPDADRDHGRMDATKEAKDDGKFKTPGLRDVAKTGPYFHDGSVKTLSEAIDFMVKGGNKNPNRDEKLKPSRLNAKDRKALQAFLESLTGTATFTKSPELP